MSEHTNFLIDTWTIQHQLVSLIFPVGVTLVVCLIDFAVCKWVCGEQEKMYSEKLGLPLNYDFLSVDEKMLIVINQRAIAAKGNPAERLFLKTVPVVAIVAFLICFFSA